MPAIDSDNPESRSKRWTLDACTPRTPALHRYSGVAPAFFIELCSPVVGERLGDCPK